MEENSAKIKEIANRLESLLSKQAGLVEETNRLRQSLNSIKSGIKADKIVTAEKPEARKLTPAVSSLKVISTESVSAETPLRTRKTSMPLSKSSLEKFIGENLINKIGIIITVLGVGIGAKYSIDNGLISPLTRIILGYLMGFGLLGFGMKLKTKIESYSAVLVSGAMAILYFITYLGYELYHLFPQLAAFSLMLVFTAFTVYAALNYNKQIISTTRPCRSICCSLPTKFWIWKSRYSV